MYFTFIVLYDSTYEKVTMMDAALAWVQYNGGDTYTLGLCEYGICCYPTRPVARYRYLTFTCEYTRTLPVHFSCPTVYKQYNTMQYSFIAVADRPLRK